METNNALIFLKSKIGQDATDSPSPFMRWLNPTIISVEEGSVCFQYTVREEMLNPVGILHGGVSAGIIDDAIGAAVFSLGEKQFYTSINNALDYFAPAFPMDILLVEARILKRGKKIIHAQCEIWNEGKGRLISKGSSNLICTDKE